MAASEQRYNWLEPVRTSEDHTVVCSHLLIAAGRVPNTEALNLAAAGIAADDGGHVMVNERLETSMEGVYALGDVKGGPAFTHISYDDFRILRTNLLEYGEATIYDRPVQILGAAILAMEGGEIMAMIELAMMGRLPYSALRDGVFAHPSLSESLNNLFSKIEDD